jgi:chaperonin cofactor prefoldin
MAKAKKSAVTKAVELAASKLNSEIQKLTAKQAELGEQIEALQAQRDAIIATLPAEVPEVATASENTEAVATN